jgi:hypothetical protein
VHLKWELEPLQLSGLDGSESRRSAEDDYQVVATEGPSGAKPRYACDFRQAMFGLRAGRWRVSLTSPATSSTCEATLSPNDSGTLVRFTAASSGCRTTTK